MTIETSLAQVTGLASQVGSLVGIGAASTSADNVSIIVGSQAIAGWQRVRISRSIERIPSDFEIELTEAYPTSFDQVTILPGQACQVKIGPDLVLTGYVDRYIPRIEEGSHSISISGRSKCMDLVDCSAEWDGGQISGTSAVDIASKLAAPYGIITKVLQDPDGLIAIPQFNLMLGETAAEIIERVTRYSALLYYDDTDGNLILSQVSQNKAASGFNEGINVQSAMATYSADQRFSEYDVVLQSMATLGDQGNQGFIRTIEKDAGVIRNRKKIIVCESGAQGIDISERRAKWERNRRLGRAYQVEVTTDSWRDSAGQLWTPNTIVPLNLPSMKMVNVNFTVGEVTYNLDDRGTTATLILMPPSAFSVEPIIIQPQPLAEIGGILHVPGGNQSPATPNLSPPVASPAVSPGAFRDALTGKLTTPGSGDFLADIGATKP